ncbi:hypothetical protein A2851_03560 [Candidatus Kaiserbacteria bacterium RIFCSPHIGHO2_01_FULL_53_29]|uniref:Tryptophan synthase beta chain-like PALP domain-containing protein n=1 Tax=Candidatus Kaiserbacteria bacterium RIFCSPHIGHO2_01_FULL_53_29 TaxID=1798480 RepID=A0A1F6CY49_9BACT|nr:MAG: hypothetical protein A2851_03560 [Candidatus Kaiserbacteria bacterium RIFCSPHIGHO2_01_FULL_53_29]
MKAEISSAELVEAFSMSTVTEVYGGPLTLTNLKDTLKTSGDLWVVRGDLAPGVPNAKSFVYELLFERVKEELDAHPDYAVSDGVGSSGVEAMHFHAQLHNRRCVFVIAREFELPLHVASWGDVEFIRADGLAEWGYVRKLAEVLRTRTDIIPLHQAFYGPRAMARVGNRVVQELEKLGVRPDASVFVAASASSLWGIGKILANRFSSETILATKYTSIDRAILRDESKMRTIARNMLKGYSMRNPSASTPEVDRSLFPLHVALASVPILRCVALTGKPGIDLVVRVTIEDADRVQTQLRAVGYNWTYTTAFALVKAIQLANEGKNVVAMVYGANRNT